MRKWLASVIDDRFLILMIPSALVLASDMPTLMTLLYVLSLIISLVGVAHWLRLILFPHFDARAMFVRIEENAIACAITVASMTFMLLAMFAGLLYWLTH
ncbi:hypothetical protein ACODYM_29340 [Burkholderia gladioli]|uniref:hypothetical protein n=1 Tax=Burkholderia gladioli TaxID=28095 RepID=UPI003B5058CE